ncbi:MAG: sulfur carrier protein ThiS [Planctomycetota bacterium]
MRRIAVSGDFHKINIQTYPVQITVNGKLRECREGTSLSGLLVELGVKRGGVAVELNREIVPRSKHETTILRPGDVIEIVTFVGGG